MIIWFIVMFVVVPAACIEKIKKRHERKNRQKYESLNYTWGKYVNKEDKHYDDWGFIDYTEKKDNK